jgi:hypothetical protein
MIKIYDNGNDNGNNKLIKIENLINYGFTPYIKNINVNICNNYNDNNYKKYKSYYYIIDSESSPALAHWIYV